MRRLEEGRRRVDGEPYLLAGDELRISTSAGIAMFRATARTPTRLFRNAEAALKKSGSGEGYLFYRKEMTERIAEKLALEKPAAAGARKGGVRPALSAKVDLEKRRIVGHER